jgi:hypothetical protein
MNQRLPILIRLLLLTVICFCFGAPNTQLAYSAPPDAIYIYLQYATFDPLEAEPAIPVELLATTDENSPGLYLVQFDAPIEEEWLQAVEATGAQIAGYVPDYAYIVDLDRSMMETMRLLPDVRWIGPYHPAYRMSAGLIEEAQDNILDLTVTILPDSDLEKMTEQITGWGGSVVEKSANEFSGYLRIQLPGDLLDELARSEDVLWIEPYVQPQLLNDIAGGTIMRAEMVRSGLGLFGLNQVAAVADTGLDVGTTGSAMSDDFEGRIVEGKSICSLFGGRSTWNDMDGHGTHVSGSILGNGVLSGSSPSNNFYTNSFAGIAPKAKIVFQAVDDGGADGLECVPTNLKDDLFGPAYSKGARVHSNSWGGSSGNSSNPWGVYTSMSQAVDQTAWAYPELLIVFAAGNSGKDADKNGVVDADSLAMPGTAKNALTVGASENYRPEKTWTYAKFSGFPKNPIYNDRVANNINGMAAFSSRGPSDDGRIKPDIVAPGTYILSARSHDPAADVLWEAYNQHYMFSGGTSMATPLAAGSALLAREWLTRLRNISNPSAALIKGVLINGAADLYPGQYGTGSTQEVPGLRPNRVTGWGRVDVKESLYPDGKRQVWLRDDKNGLSTSKSKTYQFSLGAPTLLTIESLEATGGPLHVTLIWTDYPGSPSAGKALVNDLDLELIAPDGKHYYGNSGVYSSGSCLRGGLWDACNNVEGIIIPQAFDGTYSLIVYGYNVPNGPQPFALVVSGDCVNSGCDAFNHYVYLSRIAKNK